MDKHRIYELAKELNTTSKRLMEKLAEININVKNHMSLLSDDELNALYKHIGVIRHDDGKKEETEVKKSPPPVQQHAEVKKDVKSAPRIIRTTEIFIDSKNENMDVRTRGWNDNRGNDTRKDSKGSVKNNNTRRQDIVHVADANSGLRAGFIRDTRSEFRKNVKKSDLKVAGEGARVENKPEHREDASIEPMDVRDHGNSQY
jgi:translation initiation factor IF-2